MCGDKPMKSKAGNVSNEPLPARVLIIPATNPQIMARR